MVDRRTLLRGLAALPVAGATAPIGAVTTGKLTALGYSFGPIGAMAARYAALIAEINATADDPRAEAAYEEAYGLQVAAMHYRPASLGEAAAALAWARMEFASNVHPNNSDWLDLWTLHMLDRALAALAEALPPELRPPAAAPVGERTA